MVILEAGVVLLALGFVLSLAVVAFVIIFVYTHLDKKLAKKLKEITDAQKELKEFITRANNSRVSESRDLDKRIEELENKIDVLVKPESEEKELEKEKIKAHAHK